MHLAADRLDEGLGDSLTALGHVDQNRFVVDLSLTRLQAPRTDGDLPWDEITAAPFADVLAIGT